MCAYVSGREPIASPQCTAGSISRVRGVSSELCCVACREIARLQAVRQLYDMVPKDKDFLV